MATVTYHPVFHKYYSLRLGNLNYPLETWNQTGGLSIYPDTCGIDTRGIWWNPNTNQIERNCFSTIGWATMNLNGSGNATHNFTMLFAGLHQPNVQAIAAYDYKTNTVLFYNDSGGVSVYNRSTNNYTTTISLTGGTGLWSVSNINHYSIIYTGETGYEIGLLDWVNKRVILFNRATGVYSGSSQLPSTAITHNQYRFCYANNRVWLFNATLRKWNSYNIWNQPLPIHLLSFTVDSKDDENVLCQWKSVTEFNNDIITKIAVQMVVILKKWVKLSWIFTLTCYHKNLW